MTRKADELLRTRVSRNANEEMEEHLTPLQKIADVIAWFSGSISFLLINAVWFALWIGLNTLPIGFEPFDPYPFGLLTMIVSLEAIFLSCFVLVSQNRQTEKDRVRSDIEYEVNVKAELEVTHLHEKTDRMYEHMLGKFAQLKIYHQHRQANAGEQSISRRSTYYFADGVIRIRSAMKAIKITTTKKMTATTGSSRNMLRQLSSFSTKPFGRINSPVSTPGVPSASGCRCA